MRAFGLEENDFRCGLIITAPFTSTSPKFFRCSYSEKVKGNSKMFQCMLFICGDLRLMAANLVLINDVGDVFHLPMYFDYRDLYLIDRAGHGKRMVE